MQTLGFRKFCIIGVLLTGSVLFAAGCGEADLDGASVESSGAALGATRTVFEAESLTRTASAIGSKVTSDGAASGGQYVEFNGTAASGAWIEFTLPNVAAGTYDVKFLFKSNTNRGIIQASIDGANQGAACNEYAAAVAYKVSCSLGSKVLSAGNHQIRFTVTSKSSASSGYQMTVDQLSLTAKSVGPCDIYGAGGTPCVAAHSTVRALFGAYSGKLYQIRSAAAGATKDIGTVIAGGAADAAAQDSFCAGTTCVITAVYDQSGKGNDLWYQGAGSPVGGMDQAASATTESLKVSGNKAYSLYIKQGNSYWADGSQRSIPLGSAPEAMYMVTSGTNYNAGYGFDYGNVPTSRRYVPGSASDALNFSNITAWGTGAGTGPWVMADFEAGIFTQGNSSKNLNDPTQTAPFVTALLKNNGTTEFALRGGNATSGTLGTYYKGALPPGMSPMQKQGGIVLGSGGDCCLTNTSLSRGTFYEGCIVSGYPSDATEDAVQANIIAAGYSRS